MPARRSAGAACPRRAPFKFLLRQFGVRQVERRGHDRHAFQQPPFAHRDHIFVAS